MSINRNRSAAQKFIAQAKQLGSVAVARVEAHKVYNSYGTCTRCFPHGQETINNKWRNAKGRKWNKNKHRVDRQYILNEKMNNDFGMDEFDSDDRWLELNPEYSKDADYDEWDIFDWDDGGEKSALPAGWKVMDVCNDEVRKQIQAMEAEVDLHDYHYDMEDLSADRDVDDLTEDDYNWLLEIEKRSTPLRQISRSRMSWRETVQPDAVYHDHYVDGSNFQDDECNYDSDPFDDFDEDYEEYLIETAELIAEPLEMIRLRGGAYVTL
jgi:hypothetical protein